jgi:hypothetical protein
MASASAFSVYEVLYQDDLALTSYVEMLVDESARDPFDIIAEHEELLGYPIALS